MDEVGGSAGAVAEFAGARSQGEPCLRCGSFAPLRNQLGRELCAECWERVIAPGLTVRQVLGDARRLALP